MRVYMDEVFLLNFLINWLLLKASQRLTGAQGNRWRQLAAGAIGGVYSAVVFLPGLHWLANLPGWAAAFVLMCAVAFGPSKQALKPAAWYFAVCCGFSGLALVAARLLGTRAMLVGGTAYYGVSFQLLLLLAGGVYFLCAGVIPRLVQHGGGELVQLKLTLCGKSVEVTALRDTGNTLKDPLSGEGVLVADWQTAEKLLPGGLVSRQKLLAPAELMKELLSLYPETRPRLIPYRAVGKENGLLLGVRCECSTDLGQKKRKGIVAFSPTAVSDGGLYQALIGGCYA